MRTTVDLAPQVLQRIKELASERGASVSTTIAELTARGLSELHGPMRMRLDVRSGFPVLSFGRPVTAEDIADALDDE